MSSSVETPVILGFHCSSQGSTEGPRPSTVQSSTRASSNSSVGLLSVLLSTGLQLQASSSLDEDDDSYSHHDSDSECEQDWNLEQGQEPACQPVSPRGVSASLPPARRGTTPLDVPDKLYLKDVSAVNELRRLHYERHWRAAQVEQAHQQAHQQARDAAQQAAAQRQYELQCQYGAALIAAAQQARAAQLS